MKGRFAVVLVAVTASVFSVAGCGGSSSDNIDPEPGPNDAGYPFDQVKIAADGYPEIPWMTPRQKAEVRSIARQDPYLRENLKGIDGKWGKVGLWTRSNQELLGGVIEIRFKEPVDFEQRTWPEITNDEELNGKTGPEGAPLEDPVPRIEPEIGTTVSTDEGVRYLYVMVDLEQGRVARVERMGF